jgi:hypothetical protein
MKERRDAAGLAAGFGGAGLEATAGALAAGAEGLVVSAISAS